MSEAREKSGKKLAGKRLAGRKMAGKGLARRRSAGQEFTFYYKATILHCEFTKGQDREVQ